MVWDYFVYGRGTEQSDGFRLRHAPEYMTNAVMNTIGGFFSLSKAAKDKSVFPRELLEKYTDPWHSSFLFFNMPECCVLARLVRKEGINGEPEVLDFGGRVIWSMEGMVCEKEMAPLFFASIPSMILWLKQKGSASLYTMSEKGEIGTAVNISSDFEINVYDDDHDKNTDDPANMVDLDNMVRGLLADKNERNTFFDLITAVKNADAPFTFVYGPLAEAYYRQFERGGLIKRCFSPEKSSGEKEEKFDIVPVTLKISGENQKKMDLCIMLSGYANDKCGYKWVICDSMTGEKVLESEDRIFPAGSGMSIDNIFSEAEGIKTFAENIGWETVPGAIDPSKDPDRNSYSFKKGG